MTKPAELLPSYSAWKNQLEAVLWSQQQDYEVLRDTVIMAFNPPDPDMAELVILTDCLDLVWAFVTSIPCTCPDDDPLGIRVCRRCLALGRSQDRPLER